MTTEENKKRKRRRNRGKKKQDVVKGSNAFVWEYAFESITERRTKFLQNHPEYD